MVGTSVERHRAYDSDLGPAGGLENKPRGKSGGATMYVAIRGWFSKPLRGLILIVALVATLGLSVLAGQPRSAQEIVVDIRRGMTEKQVIAILGEPHGDRYTKPYSFEGVFEPGKLLFIYSGSNVSFESWIDDRGYLIVAFAPEEDFEAVRTLTREELARLLKSNPSSGPKRWYVERVSHLGLRLLTADEREGMNKRQKPIHLGPRRVAFTHFRKVVAKEGVTLAEKCRRWVARVRTSVGI
jgi:hypothetical protein